MKRHAALHVPYVERDAAFNRYQEIAERSRRIYIESAAHARDRSIIWADVSYAAIALSVHGVVTDAQALYIVRGER